MDTLYLLVLIIAAAVGAQWLGSRIHVPGLLLLVVTGVFLGPVSGVLDPEEVFGDLQQPFIQLAAAVILFEGGLSLHLREARHVGPILWRLILSGLFLGFGLVTAAAMWVGGLEPPTAAVLGAILVVTGPTVIIPMLRSARISFRPAALLKWEGIVNDPFGAILAIIAMQVAILMGSTESGSVVTLVLELLGYGLAAAALGSAIGWLLARALDSGIIREDLKSPVMLAAVMSVFALAELIHHEYGLLAVTAMGLVIGNAPVASLEDIRHFKEQVSTLLVGFVFLVLSARLEPEILERVPGYIPLILVILFVARPLVVLAGTIGSKIPWNERVLIGWIAPRGVVAAAVAGAFEGKLREAGVSDANDLVPIVFGVILATVVLHGLSIRPLSRLLKLASRPGNGILVVGASTWAVAMAHALVQAGAFVVVADTRYRRVVRARLEGLEVHFGDVLSEETALELPFERVSWLLAATADDSYNSLVTVTFAREFDRSTVLQLTPGQATGSAKGREVRAHLTGVTPWDEEGTYGVIARRYWQGAKFKVTQTTEQFTWVQLRIDQPDALFLFYVHQAKLGVLREGVDPPMGSKIVFLSEDDSD